MIEQPDEMGLSRPRAVGRRTALKAGLLGLSALAASPAVAYAENARDVFQEYSLWEAADAVLRKYPELCPTRIVELEGEAAGQLVKIPNCVGTGPNVVIAGGNQPTLALYDSQGLVLNTLTNAVQDLKSPVIRPDYLDILLAPPPRSHARALEIDGRPWKQIYLVGASYYAFGGNIFSPGRLLQDFFRDYDVVVYTLAVPGVNAVNHLRTINHLKVSLDGILVVEFHPETDPVRDMQMYEWPLQEQVEYLATHEVIHDKRTATLKTASQLTRRQLIEMFPLLSHVLASRPAEAAIRLPEHRVYVDRFKAALAQLLQQALGPRYIVETPPLRRDDRLAPLWAEIEEVAQHTGKTRAMQIQPRGRHPYSWFDRTVHPTSALNLAVAATLFETLTGASPTPELRRYVVDALQRRQRLLEEAIHPRLKQLAG